MMPESCRPSRRDEPHAPMDEELGHVLDHYLAEREAGRPVDPRSVLGRHPELVDRLRACLGVLELAGDLGGTYRDPGETARADGSASSPGSVLTAVLRAGGEPPRVLLAEPGGPEPPPVVAAIGGDRPATGRYRLHGEIARGGMGAVLRARDEDLGRDVAVKVLLDHNRDDPAIVRRFVEEAQIGGQLQHPGIVPVFELGVAADHRPFIAMKLVRGRTLAALLADRRDPADDLPRLLGIYQQICQTVAYAHARGVIHRDLKPSNVMVGDFGEVQVMDWGLAKVLQRGGLADAAAAGKTREETVITTARSGEPDAEHSRAGSVMGTPAYMAPEQARGEGGEVDERADVFALGSILCELLIGRPAFTGPSAGAIRAQAARGDLAGALARLDACGADAELRALARDCLAPGREGRPRDASAVATRVNAYLAGVQEKLRAAELRGIEDRARRRLTTVVAASLLAMTTAGSLGFTSWQQRRQAAAARAALTLKEATLLRDQARDHPEDPTRWPAALASLERAEAALSDGGTLEARKQFAALAAAVRAGAEAAARDRRLLDRLVDIRTARTDDPDGSATDTAYADAFREAGIDVEAAGPAEVGALIAGRPAPVRRALVAALDHWTGVRRARGVQGAGWPRLLAVARAADPDPDRDPLRAALLVS